MADDNERLRQAIRVGNIGIFEHDHDAEVIFWSPELRQMYGWDLTEEATLPKILTHVWPEDTERVIQAVRRAHDPSGDGAFDIEHRIVARNGDVRWVLTRSRTHFSESSAGQARPLRTIGAVQDVTDRRRADEQLRALEAKLNQAQKLESIGRLAGGIAHDFNNLLTVILGGIDVSLMALASDHPGRNSLRDATAAAQSAAALTRQLLAFSRKEASAPRPLDLNAVVSRMKTMLARLVGDDIRVETLCGRDVPQVWFDPVQIEQVILNLAVNARDAMAGGGRLTIASSLIDPPARELTPPGTDVLLSVSDTGVGIADEVRAHLFEPFFTTKEAGKGTGLGLAVVYGAVQQHGGHIEVESEVGRGSTFKVYLRSVP
jgi:PAS domain S-box-containing protein